MRRATLAHQRAIPHGAKQEAQRLVGAPTQALFRRGLEDGTLRDDLDADTLARLFGGLVLAAVQAGLPRTLGIEQTAASLASLFLDGARRHPA